jgi:hypothetical protein
MPLHNFTFAQPTLIGLLTTLLPVIVQFALFLRWLHRRMREDEIVHACVRDIALNHLPHIYNSTSAATTAAQPKSSARIASDPFVVADRIGVVPCTGAALLRPSLPGRQPHHSLLFLPDFRFSIFDFPFSQWAFPQTSSP